MTCRELAEMLIDFVDGTLEAEKHTLLERHLCGCVPCAIYMTTYRQTIRITHSLPDVPLPPEFACRLKSMMEQINAEG